MAYVLYLMNIFVPHLNMYPDKMCRLAAKIPKDGFQIHVNLISSLEFVYQLLFYTLVCFSVKDGFQQYTI